MSSRRPARAERWIRPIGVARKTVALKLGASVALVAILLAQATPRLVEATDFTGTYTFGADGNVTAFPYNGTAIPNLTVSDLTKVGVPSTSNVGNFRATEWPLDAGAQTLTGAIDPAKYFEFTLTAAEGYTFDMTSLGFGVGRSGTGPRSFQWRSDTDSYASVISGYTSVNAALNQTLGAGILSYTADGTTSATGNVLGLATETYEGLSAITFRFYGYNAEQVGGTGGLQGNFTFAGTLIPPTGVTYIWTGSGSGGTWANGQQGQFDAAYVDSGISTAQFGGTGETVTVAGAGVQVGQVEFTSSGYSLSGGPLTLGQGTITTAAATSASIASVVAGTAGIAKAGPGTLSLGGENTFSGNVAVSAGTLSIANDAALGDAANAVSVSGTLQTTATLALGAGRDLSGSGTLDIANGTTLTVNGATSMTGLTLANSGTLSLQGATRSVGSLAVNAAAEIQASGAVSVTGLTATGLTSGTATIAPALVFTTGDKTVNVPGTGRLVLEGDVSGLGSFGRLAKTGTGTLVVDGPISSGGLRVGSTGSSPTNGGSVVLSQASSVGSNSLQLNYGTLSTTANGGIETTQGLSVGGRTGAVAVIGGSEPMTFNGQSSFFRGTGTSGELRLDVDNETTLGGGFAATSGGGTATGITIGGSGKLTLAGDGSLLVDAITLQDTLDLLVEGSVGSGVTAGATNAIGGDGTIGGSLSLLAGAGFVFATNKTLTVNGGSVTFGDFGVSDLLGFSAAIPDGTYTLIDGLATVSTTNLRNLGRENAFDLGGGRSAYFETGSLILQVVPEPSSLMLAGLGGLLAAGYAARRRRARAVEAD